MMNSPFTGKPMQLKQSLTLLSYRNKSFEVVYQYYYCEDSQETFTNEELDQRNMEQVYAQYRKQNDR
ncbi:hypothetical protein [Persicobacter diffluens]|uniref:Uncharacterized protein n=1 Tax=Persicobacter diffluens TaxID=981 RepID=A0AAN4W3E5_9BACT|nr:hypothetical protein PEDI_55460 [Persicobacter diffluens]